jgi:hypothetical protein
MIRAPKRSKFKDFFRVVAGQIAQIMERDGLLKEKVTERGRSTSSKTVSEENVFNVKHGGLLPGAAVNPRVTDTPTGLRAHRKTSSEGGNIARRDREDALEARQSLSHDGISPNIGQIKGTKLWKYRPFTRVIRGFKAYRIVRDYIQLNELEARGKIPYRKARLRGLSAGEWELLWC